MPDDELGALLRGGRARPVGRALVAAAERARAEYRAIGRAALGSVSFAVDGGPPGGLYGAVLDPTRTFDRTELVLSGAPSSGALWEFVRPFRAIVLGPEGTAELRPAGGAPERSIARVLPREGYGAPPVAAEYGPGRLPTFAQFARSLREGGYVPFGIALELYGPIDRLRYEIDLGNGRLLADPRAGRWPESGRRPRPTRAAWTFDQSVSAANLPPDAARTLEVIWESGTVSAPDLGRVFGNPDASIELLLGRKLIEPDPAGGWRPRFEPGGRPLPPAPSSTRSATSGTALRQSMNELLAGAEARATCPVCGEEVPPGFGQLLCDRCQREVAEAGHPG